MTTLLEPVLLGSQEPRVLTRPPYVSEDAAVEAIELAESVGLVLDPWQRLVVRVAMAETSELLWAARETGLLVPRQNGKGAAWEAIFLHGLFLDERMKLQLWTAHQFKTSSEAFIRIRGWIDGSDDLRKQVKRVIAAHGEEGFELKDGSRLRFLARSKSSGRGFSPQRLGLDEAQELSEAAYEAIVPSMSAQAAKQILYAGTPPGPETNHPEVFTRVLTRGRSGTATSLAWLEWSPNGSDDPEAAERIDLDDPAHWAAANPGLGYRPGLTQQTIADEREAFTDEGYGRERLVIWPTPAEGADWIIPKRTWTRQACWDEETGEATREITSVPVFALDVAADRGLAHIAAAGATEPGEGQDPEKVALFEHIESLPPDKAAKRLGVLAAGHRADTVIIDAASEAASLVDDLEDEGLRVISADVREVAEADAQWYDAITAKPLGTAYHLDQDAVTGALAGAEWRELEGHRLLGRRKSAAEIAPLRACTLALWGHSEYGDYDVSDSVM